MIFNQIVKGGCQSYLVGCEATGAAVLIDPEHSQIDRYLGLAQQSGVQIRYIIDTHTHADHFSASRDMGRALSAPVVMYRTSPAPGRAPDRSRAPGTETARQQTPKRP